MDYELFNVDIGYKIEIFMIYFYTFDFNFQLKYTHFNTHFSFQWFRHVYLYFKLR